MGRILRSGWRPDPATGRGTSGDASASPRRVPELDGLRGIAALAVVIFHVNPPWLPFGWAAVDLFFVLSGYLITAIILREGHSPGFLPTFYRRRGLRTWPIYYLTLAAIVLLAPILTRPYRWWALPSEIAYLQGLPHAWGAASARFTAYLNHTWSLAIEEQFYLIWPALVLLAGCRARVVAALASTCALGSIVARSRGMAFDCLPGRADGLALGGLLAALTSSGATPLRRPIARFGLISGTVAGLALFAARGSLAPGSGLVHHPGSLILAVNLASFGLIGLLIANPTSRAWSPLRFPPIQGLGKISYALYLYHFPLLIAALDLARRLGIGGKLQGVRLLAIVASIGLAALSWRFLERPLLARKDRLTYRPDPHTGRGDLASRGAEAGRR